jgi:hypothetical protein
VSVEVYLITSHTLTNNSRMLIDPYLWCSGEHPSEQSGKHKILSLSIFNEVAHKVKYQF